MVPYSPIPSANQNSKILEVLAGVGVVHDLEVIHTRTQLLRGYFSLAALRRVVKKLNF